ncbi:hypothetical protein [Armatimonas sp.]|uniref:hypothetical protein n=1 Tax=Armatimonas sp. TaxID=1872638 RepID=UPI00286AFCBC|nr:hypothetical protein [Armatimonas sp.]
MNLDTPDFDDDKAFQKALPTLRIAPTPSAELEARVQALEGKRKPRRTLVLGLTLGGLAAAGALVGVVLAPRIALAQALTEAEKHLRDGSLHSTMTWIFEGKPRIRQETWIVPGKRRTEHDISGQPVLISLETESKYWLYQPEIKVATWQISEGFLKQELAQSGAEIQTLQEAGVRLLRRPVGVQDEGEITRAGRRFRCFSQPQEADGFLLRGKSCRSLAWVDLAQKRLDRVELQMKRQETWETRVQLDYHWERPFPEELFSTKFPGAKIYELDRFGQEAGRHFAKPLAVQKFASRTIALRDVQVNAEGDVFVLFTDGARPEKPHAEASVLSKLTDSRGTRYAGTIGAMEPFMEVSNGKDRGLTVGGEMVQGACFTHAMPLDKPWKPRTFQIHMHFNELIGKKYYTRYAKFSVSVTRPKTPLLPDYATALRVLSLPGGEKMRFEKDRDSGRQSHAWNERRWAELLTLTRQSLKRYPDEFWPRLYQVQALRHLGRLSEARMALNKLLPEAGFNQREAEEEASKLRRAEQGKPEPGD